MINLSLIIQKTRLKLNNNMMYYKSRVPICYYLWVILNISTIVVFYSQNSIIESLVYSLFFVVVTYIIICRNACRILIDGNVIKVCYLFPLFHKEVVEIQSGSVVQYDLSYYYYFSSSHRLGPIQLLRPFDKIQFSSLVDKNKIKYAEIYLFASYEGLKKLKTYLQFELKVVEE